MKRISFICVLILLCSLPGQAQFWISFGWNEPHCQSCLWMEQAMRLNGRQAADYHNIVHKYGQKIEKEARKHYRYWDQSAKKIFNLRMERDRRLQRVLSPSQFPLSANVRSVSMIIRVGITILIIRTIARQMSAGVMKTITGIINGNIQTDDGMDVLMTVNGIGVNMTTRVIMITDSGVRTIITVLIQIITSISISPRNREIMTGMTEIKDPTSGVTVIVTMINAMISAIKTKKRRIKKKTTINGSKVNVLKCIAEADNC